MKFGTHVLVARGGMQLPHPGGVGGKRKVRGILVGAHGYDRFVKLTEADPFDTVGWREAGQVGCWSASAVEPDPDYLKG